MPANRNRNRRRHANALPIAQMATWVLFAAFAGAGGLYYVYCKNEVHARGTVLKALEKELTGLRTQNEVAKSRVATLSAPKALMDRRKQDPKNFLAEYVDVTHDRLVVLTSPAGRAPDLRAVSNPAAHR